MSSQLLGCLGDGPCFCCHLSGCGGAPVLGGALIHVLGCCHDTVCLLQGCLLLVRYTLRVRGALASPLLGGVLWRPLLIW